MTQAAVVTWLYQHTHSTYLISVFLVGLILSVTTGGLASAPLLDRIGSFRVLSWVEGLRGGLTLLLIPAAVGGQVYLVIAICTLSSFLSAATKPSAAGLVPDVLPPSCFRPATPCTTSHRRSTRSSAPPPAASW